MKGIRSKISIDKLAIRCIATDEFISLLDEIAHKYVDSCYEFENVKLVKMPDNVKKNYDTSFHFMIKNCDEEKGFYWEKYGELSYLLRNSNNNNINKNYVWIYVANKTLYTKMYLNDIKGTYLHYLSYILEKELNLKYNQIINLDIALDSNVNMAKRLKKIHWNKNFNSIVNGIVYLDTKEEINEIDFLHKSNQERYTDMTIYIRSKNEPAELCFYNKNKEIRGNSNKEYIEEITKLKRGYRAEVRLKTEQLQEAIFKNNINDINSLIVKLQDEDFLLNVFIQYSNKLIKFKNIKTGCTISLLEAIFEGY